MGKNESREGPELKISIPAVVVALVVVTLVLEVDWIDSFCVAAAKRLGVWAVAPEVFAAAAAINAAAPAIPGLIPAIAEPRSNGLKD